MIVDPNVAIETYFELISCRIGQVALPDGSLVDDEALNVEDGLFAAFCRSLDPHRCFLVALIPAGGAVEATYFKAREAAQRFGLSVQSHLAPPEECEGIWQSNLEAKRRSIKPDESEES
jgi:hypothetical protein